MARPDVREVLPCGEIRTPRDAQGRLIGAVYVLDGKAWGWRLEIDHATRSARFISPDRSDEQRWEGDGLEGFIERCLVDIRDTGYVQVARTATRALDAGELDRAERLFRAFEDYARRRPRAYNPGALGRIIATAALVKAAKNAPGADILVATALAAALAVDGTEEKGTSALGRRMKRVLGDRLEVVLRRAAGASLAALEADWQGVDEGERWRQLTALRDRMELVAGPDGVAALAEAAGERETDDRNLARFAQVLASRTGQFELLGELSERLAVQQGATIADLNNQANALLHQGNHDEAESLLAEVACRLGVEAGSDRQALIDEYFYRANLAELRWRQGRYRDGLAPAERAYQLERQIADMHVYRSPAGGPPVFDTTAMFSSVTWAIISIYTRLGQIDDAERVFESELTDEARLAARRAANSDAIENAFNAGMCIYSENKTPDKMARGQRLFRLLCERIPVPTSIILTWCYACAYGYYGEEDKAREFLERAIAMGASRAELRNDPDFDPVRDRPWFTALVG